jgi:flagellar motor switch protein FliG
MRTALFVFAYVCFFISGVCIYLYYRSRQRLKRYEEMVRIMEQERNGEIATNWRSTKFTARFELDEMLKFDSKTIQEVIKEHRKDLPIAFFGFSDELKKKFLENMSENARGVLDDNMHLISQVKNEDLEQVLDEIKWTAWALSPLH